LDGNTPEEAICLANTAAFRMITSHHGIIDLIKENKKINNG
jgi:hypothetical protein